MLVACHLWPGRYAACKPGVAGQPNGERAADLPETVYTVAFAAIAVAGPNVVRRDKISPRAFTKEQMGHHDVETE